MTIAPFPTTRRSVVLALASTDEAERTYDESIVKSARLPQHQLARLYPPDTVDLLMGKVGAFRGLHTHGRAMAGLYSHAADDHEQRFILDGRQCPAAQRNGEQQNVERGVHRACQRDLVRFHIGRPGWLRMESAPAR